MSACHSEATEDGIKSVLRSLRIEIRKKTEDLKRSLSSKPQKFFEQCQKVQKLSKSDFLCFQNLKLKK
jgi:hypothetical protein